MIWSGCKVCGFPVRSWIANAVIYMVHVRTMTLVQSPCVRSRQSGSPRRSTKPSISNVYPSYSPLSTRRKRSASRVVRSRLRSCSPRGSITSPFRRPLSSFAFKHRAQLENATSCSARYDTIIKLISQRDCMLSKHEATGFAAVRHLPLAMQHRYRCRFPHRRAPRSGP